MSNNNFNNKNLDSIVSMSGGKLNRKTLENAAKNGNTDALINNLSAEEKQKLNSVLSDKTALENLLKSPQAAMLLKLLSGGGKNG
jgi:hypothetical protein